MRASPIHASIDGESLRLLNCDDGRFTLPLATFWRIVRVLEAKGLRREEPAPERKDTGKRGYRRVAQYDPDRPRRAYAMHEGGADWPTVARATGYISGSSAAAGVRQYLKTHKAPSLNHCRGLEVDAKALGLLAGYPDLGRTIVNDGDAFPRLLAAICEDDDGLSECVARTVLGCA